MNGPWIVGASSRLVARGCLSALVQASGVACRREAACRDLGKFTANSKGMNG